MRNSNTFLLHIAFHLRGRVQFLNRKSASTLCIIAGLLVGVSIIAAGILENAHWLMAIGVVTILLAFVIGNSLVQKTEHKL
jgi:hypothetical protein